MMRQWLARWVCWFRGSHLWHYGNPEDICERCGAPLDNDE